MMQQGGNSDKRRIHDQMDRLWQEIEGFAQEGTAAQLVERHLFRELLKMGRELLGYFFRQLGSGDQGPQVTFPDGRVLRRLFGMRERRYQSVFGEFVLSRWVYGSREKQAQEYVPLDARLQLPESSFSYLLQDWAQALAVEFSFEHVAEVLGRILGLKLGVSALERMNRGMADAVAAYTEATPAQPAQAGEFIVASADGKGVPMRKAADQPPIRAHDGRRGPAVDRKKMAILGAVYEGQAHVRMPEQVLEALFGKPAANDEAPVKRPRPKPIAKAVKASLTHTAADGTVVNAREVIFPWLRDQVRQRDPDGQKPVIVLMDGQHCLWTDAQKALAGRSRVEILDLLHATSKLWEVAHAFHAEVAGRLTAMKGYTLWLLRGKAADLATLFRHWADTKSLDPVARKKVETVCAYFEQHQERMRYHEYLAAGYPIASGVIEGACRHVVKDRLERTGMHWTIAGAQAMMKLRCVAINGQWDEFTAFRIQRETQRLYPHTTLYEIEAWPMNRAA
jgi:hypothetical protein